VSVGLGNASKEEIRANLGLMAQAQEKAAMVPGLIEPANVYALFKRMQTELGLDNENFITDPSKAEPKPAQPDPYLEAEKMKSQTRLQEKQIDSHDKALDRAQERDLEITKLEVESGVDLAKAGIGAEVALARGAQQQSRRGAAASTESADTGRIQ
jgi:hypothetical protein